MHDKRQRISIDGNQLSLNKNQMVVVQFTAATAKSWRPMVMASSNSDSPTCAGHDVSGQAFAALIGHRIYPRACGRPFDLFIGRLGRQDVI